MLVSPMLAIDEAKDEDSLDSFMNTISQRMDKGTKIKLKSKIIGLKKVQSPYVVTHVYYITTLHLCINSLPNLSIVRKKKD